MLISVIMPVFNGLEFLTESVQSILGQTYTDFEFIIVDDASTEPVWDLLQSFRDERVVLRRNRENLGLTKSLNLCLQSARGEWLARHDGDDIALPHRFEREVERLSAGIGLVSCWAEAIDSRGQRQPSDWEDRVARITAEDARRALLLGNCIVAPGAIFSREVVRTIGYFDEAVRLAQDYNYWLRLIRYFRLEIVREILVLKRNHAGNVWKNPGSTDWTAFARQRAFQFPVVAPRKVF